MTGSAVDKEGQIAKIQREEVDRCRMREITAPAIGCCL